MNPKQITFDEVFKMWLDAEATPVYGRNLLALARSKGFTSITGWRLDTAKRLGMDQKEWTLEVIENPNDVLPNIIVGPYKGWSTQQGVEFFHNQLITTFAQALKIPIFLEWCSKHDRIIQISQNFPLPRAR